MRHILRMFAVTSLLGCTAPLDVSSINFVSNVQAATQSACSIIPTAQAISALVTVLFPGMLPANASIEAADRICAGFLGEPGREAPAIVGNTAKFQVEGVEITAFIIPEDER